MESHEVKLTLDQESLRDAIDALLKGNSTVRMTAQYGEWLTVKRTAEILTVSRPTVYRMIEDGRIRAVDGRVVTESIAHYLADPLTADRQARWDKRRRTA